MPPRGWLLNELAVRSGPVGAWLVRGAPASIAATLGGPTTVTLTDSDLDARELRHLPGVDRVTRHGAVIRVVGTGPLLAHVGAHLVARGRPALDLRAHHPSLEDHFVHLTQEAP